MALCWGLIVLADKWTFARREESWLLGVLMFSTFIGATKGGTTTLFGALFGVERNFGTLIGGRMIQTALLGLVTLPALAILAATRARFQEERDTLVAELAFGASNDPLVISSSNQEYRRLSEEIGRIKDGLKLGSNFAVSELIRDVVQNGLRPLTHRLWNREDQSQTNFTLRSLSRVAILTHPYVAWPVALILFLGTLGPYVSASGWTQGFLRATLTSTTIALTYLGARLLKITSSSVAWLVYIFVHILLAALIVAVSKQFFGDLQGFTDTSAFFVLFIWILQTGYMTSFVVGALATRNEMREQLQKLSEKLGLDTQVMKARAQLTKREIANYLHSDVQNKLLSIAIQVESGKANLDMVSEELTAVQRLLNTGTPLEPLDRRPIRAQLNSLIARWKGFIQIDLECDESVSDQNIVKQITLVVTEGLSNAVRHGLASKVAISVKNLGEGVLVELRDNGIGPRSGTPGLGTRFFDSVSGSNWSITQVEDGGSKLVVRL